MGKYANYFVRYMHMTLCLKAIRIVCLLDSWPFSLPLPPSHWHRISKMNRIPECVGVSVRVCVCGSVCVCVCGGGGGGGGVSVCVYVCE